MPDFWTGFVVGTASVLLLEAAYVGFQMRRWIRVAADQAEKAAVANMARRPTAPVPDSWPEDEGRPDQ